MLRLLSIACLIGLMTGLDPAIVPALAQAQAQTPAQAPAAAPRPPRPAPPTRDPHTPGYVTAKELPDGANAPANCRRKLHPRPHAQPRAGDDGAGRRAAGNGLQLHHEIGRQQDLSRHRARARHLRHAGSQRPRQADRHHQPPRSLHAPRGRLCPQAICARHGRAVHRRGGRAGPGAVHRAGQSDRRAPRAGDDRHLHRQRQRRRAGQRARPGIRHHVRACTRSSSRKKCCRWWRSNTT